MRIGNIEVYGVIYKITNRINNKIYIGQTIHGFDIRYNNNLKKNTSNNHLKKSIKKYGIENFDICKIFDIAFSKEELDIKEDIYIKIFDTMNPTKGYNKQSGGSHGLPSEETKKKISDALSRENNPFYGKHHTEETRRKMSENHADFSGENHPNYGRTMDEKQKEQLSENAKKRYKDKKNHPMHGKHHTEKAKERISKANTGKFVGENNPMWDKHHSEETKKKISDAHKGKHHSEKSKKKISDALSGENNPSATAIICLTTGRVFGTMKEGAEYYKIKNVSGICNCCKGRQKSAGKLEDGTPLVWMYLNESDLMYD